MFREAESDQPISLESLVAEKPVLFQMLNEAGLIWHEPLPSQSFAMQKKGAVNPDATRFIQGLPYWPDKTFDQVRYERKKIILNYRALILTNYLQYEKSILRRSPALQVIYFLEQLGFETYIRTAQGRLEKFSLKNIKKQWQTATITSQEIIQKKLSAEGKDIRQYYYLNDTALTHLSKQFNDFFVLRYYDHKDDVFSPQLDFGPGLTTLTPDVAKQLCENLESQVLDKMSFFIISGHKFSIYEVNQARLKVFLRCLLHLKSIPDDTERLYQLHQLFFDEMDEIQFVNDSAPSHFDFSRFSQLKSVSFYQPYKGVPNKIKAPIVEIYHINDLLQQIDPASVIELKVVGNKEVDLSQFVNLERLRIEHATKVVGLENCRKLKKISIANEYGIPRDLNPIDWSQFPQLQSLSLYYVRTQLAGIEYCAQLRELSVEYNNSITELDLSRLKNIAILYLYDCQKLRDITGLKTAVTLTELTISGCTSIISVDIIGLALLQKLHLANLIFPAGTVFECDKLLPQLTHLQLRGIQNLEKLYLPRNLKDLTVANCPPLSTIEISKCPHLSRLSMWHQRLERLDVTGLTNLKVFEVAFPDKLPIYKIDGLETLELLQSLHLWNSKKTFLPESSLTWIRKNVHQLSSDTDNFNKQDILIKIIKSQSTDSKCLLIGNYKKSLTYPRSFLATSSQIGKIEPNDDYFDMDIVTRERKTQVQKTFIDEDATTTDSCRKVVLNQIRLTTDGKLVFSSSKPDLVPIKIPTKIPESKNIKTGIIDLELAPGDIQYLTGFSPDDILLKNTDPHVLTPYFDKATRRIAIKNASKKTFNGPFAYKIQIDPTYHQSKLTEEPAESKEELLPDNIRNGIFEYLSHISKTSDFFDFIQKLKSASQLDKVNLLVDFFRSIPSTNEEELAATANDVIDALRLLENKKGVCRHRAKIMMMLCRYFHIHTNIIKIPGLHAYVEVLTKSGKWTALDLGGGHGLKVDYQSLDRDKLTKAQELEPIAGKKPQLIVDSIFDTKEIPPSQYRYCPLTNIQFDGDKLTFSVADDYFFAPAKIQPLSASEITERKRSEKLVTAVIPVCIASYDHLDLTGITAQEELVALQISDGREKDIKLLHDQSQSQHRLNNISSDDFVGFIQYTVSLPFDYPKKVSLEANFLETRMCSLPESLVSYLDEYFGARYISILDRLRRYSTRSYSYFINSLFKSSVKERVKLLFAYLCDIPERVDNNEKPDNLSTLLDIMEHKKACTDTERAKLMYLFCRYFHIPVRIIPNPISDFIEIQTTDCQWHPLYFKGNSRNEIILRDQPLMPAQNPFVEPDSMFYLTTSGAEEDKHELDEKSIYSPTLFYANTAWAYDCKQEATFFAQLIAHPGNPLFRTQQLSDANRLEQILKKHTDTNQIPHFYINSAAKLEAYFKWLLVRDKQLIEETGPLQHFIKGDKGVLVINWDEFSREQRLSYKSILDKPPTLHGQVIAPTIKIVGILHQDTKVNDVFLSRCYELQTNRILNLPKDLYPKRDWITELKEGETKACQIDLYHSSDWSLHLLEEISINGNEFTIKYGPLVEAMEQGHEISLKNPPWENKDFQRFWFGLTNEGEFYSNGKRITIHPGFKVTIVEGKSKKDIPEVVRIINATPTTKASGTTYYFNSANISSLFDPQKVEDKFIKKATAIFSQLQPGDRIVIQDSVSDDFLNLLIDKMKIAFSKLSAEHPIEIYIDPRYAKKLTEERKPSPAYSIDIRGNYFVESNDPDLFVKKLCEKGLESQRIFYIDGTDTWPALIDQVNLTLQSGKVIADRHESDFLKKLQSEGTLIIQGGLTLKAYMPLQTLFCEPPYLIVNGERCDVKAKIIWVHKPDKEYPISDAPRLSAHYSLEHYLSEIKSADIKLLNSVSDFTNHLQKLNIPITYQTFRSIYQYAKDESKASNPVKPVTSEHYRHEPEMFAYLNVLGKIYFNQSDVNYIRHEKLQSLLRALKSGEDKRKILWQMANCLSGALLRQVFLGHLKTMSFDLTENLIEQLMKTIFNAGPELHYISIQRKLHEKQKLYIKNNLVTDKRITFLTGASGLGKSTVAKDALNELGISYFYGEASITQWLASGGVLLLDEINIFKPGHWEFLNGLFLSPPVIQYLGKEYPADKHRIIATGNNLNYPRRYDHDVLKQHAHYIQFKSFKDHELKDYISALFAKYKIFSESNTAITQIISIYRLLEKSDNYALDLSLRDLDSLILRIHVLNKSLPDKPFDLITRMALRDEFSGALVTDTARIQFNKVLMGKDEIQRDANEIKGVVITDKKRPIWQMVRDDLTMRQKACEMGAQVKSVLLEGPSGVGKSTLFLSILKDMGFKDDDTADSQRRFYQITTGSLGVFDLLLKAFHEGSIVILDELNLDSSIEFLLNHLLSGTDLDNNPPRKPGFMILSSQNPGVLEQSKALLNRFHKISMGDFSVEELVEIANKFNVPKPSEFVSTYFAAKKMDPNVNPRRFFEVAPTFGRTL
ncbi:MAG: transglutaminase domain-containing protein [Gammaproteobacteria bacterium]